MVFVTAGAAVYLYHEIGLKRMLKMMFSDGRVCNQGKVKGVVYG